MNTEVMTTTNQIETVINGKAATVTQTIKTIKPPKEVSYISDIEGFKFEHGILEKTKTGAGATHFALTNDEDIILVVPFIGLITNKCGQISNVFGVYDGVHKEDFFYYLENTPVIKIMGTFDSLPKIQDWLKEARRSVSSLPLIVDEYHQLLKSYAFRERAITGVMKAVLSHERVTYISATPITTTFAPEELANLDITKIEWGHTVKMRPICMPNSKPYTRLHNLMTSHILNGGTVAFKNDEEPAKELFIFLNSVKEIARAIQKCGLYNEDVKVVCANTIRNENILEDIKISPIHEYETDEDGNTVILPNKKITFLTSTCFEGQDIYSDSGLSIVVSSTHNKFTCLDIAGDIYQIAGRLRNESNPYKYTMWHIFNTSAASVTREEWEVEKANRIAKTHLLIKDFNDSEDDVKAAKKHRYDLKLEDDYTKPNPITNELEYDKWKELHQEYVFSVTIEMYSEGVAVQDAYEKAFDGTITLKHEWTNQEFESFCRKASRYGFKEKSIDYVAAIGTEQQAIFERDTPLLKEIHETLGVGALATYDYKEDVLALMVYEQGPKVAYSILQELKRAGWVKGHKVSVKETKALLKTIAEKLKLTTAPKPKEMSKYFDVTFKLAYMEGKRTRIIEVGDLMLNSIQFRQNK